MSSTPIPLYSERDTAAVAARLAAASTAGDVYYLTGDLGAGKTTFCQYFLQALGYKGAVTSPTYTLSQEYHTPGLWVTHADCYRLNSPEEAIELGLFEASQKGILLIEWPQLAEGYIPPARRTLDFKVNTSHDQNLRTLTINEAFPKNPQTRPHRMPPRLPEHVTDLKPIPGDASFRRYYRAQKQGRPVILMHAPPPEATEPFAKIARWLTAQGFSAPQILASDASSDTLLLEDLGPYTFSKLLMSEHSLNVSERSLYILAQQTLEELWQAEQPNFLPDYTIETLLDEVMLFPQWAGDAATSSTWRQIWEELLNNIPNHQPSVVLRDFHIDNMILLPERFETQQCGLLDFQDALIGHRAYDMVSLYQDVRRDVSINLEQEALANFDDDFKKAYYTLGLQRHFKVIGIFHRLARRDGKLHYLKHMDRCWNLARRCFAAEPSLQILLEEFSLLGEKAA